MTGSFDGSTCEGWNHCNHYTDRGNGQAIRDNLPLGRATDTTAAPAA